MFGEVSRHALVALGGLVVRGVLQAAYLLLLTRALGPEGYGFFIGSAAVAVFLAPLVGMGASFLCSRDVSIDPAQVPQCWNTTLRWGLLSGPVVGTVAVFVAAILPRHPTVSVLLLLVAAEVFLFPFAQWTARLLMALRRPFGAAVASFAMQAGRVTSLSIAWLSGFETDIGMVALCHLLGSAGGAALLWGLARHSVLRYRGGARAVTPSWRLAEAIPFAMSAFVASIAVEADKIIVLQVLGPESAGQYAAAFRVAAVFTLPVVALMAAAMPKLFRANANPSETSMHSVWRLAKITGYYGFLASLACIGAAPLVPWILGEAFSASTPLVFGFAAWVPLFALHQAFGTGLSCLGLQGFRLRTDAACAVAALSLGALALPIVGVWAAVVALAGGELLAIVLLVARARRIGRGTGQVPSRTIA